MSYSRYLCVFTYSGVQHILGCVFVLFFVVFRILCCQFIWIVHFGLPLWYYLSFIYIDVAVYNDNKYKFSKKACQSIIQKNWMVRVHDGLLTFSQAFSDATDTSINGNQRANRDFYLCMGN